MEGGLVHPLSEGPGMDLATILIAALFFIILEIPWNFLSRKNIHICLRQNSTAHVGAPPL